MFFYQRKKISIFWKCYMNFFWPKVMSKSSVFLIVILWTWVISFPISYRWRSGSGVWFTARAWLGIPRSRARLGITGRSWARLGIPRRSGARFRIPRSRPSYIPRFGTRFASWSWRATRFASTRTTGATSTARARTGTTTRAMAVFATATTTTVARSLLVN